GQWGRSRPWLALSKNKAARSRALCTLAAERHSSQPEIMLKTQSRKEVSHRIAPKLAGVKLSRYSNVRVKATERCQMARMCFFTPTRKCMTVLRNANEVAMRKPILSNASQW